MARFGRQRELGQRKVISSSFLNITVLLILYASQNETNKGRWAERTSRTQEQNAFLFTRLQSIESDSWGVMSSSRLVS